MGKLQPGQHMPDFIFDTPFEKGLHFETVARGKKTALLFLRYYGCTLCQYDMMNLREQYHLFTRQGAQVLVVLQSDPGGLAGKIAPDTYPFRIVCDPGQALYRAFEIRPAKSKAGMVSPKALKKLAKVKASGLRHGEYEGDELQLPALFVMDAQGVLTHARYARDVADLPTEKELADWMNAI